MRIIRTFSIDLELFKELKKYSEENKIPMSQLLDKGIEFAIREEKESKDDGINE